MKHTKYIRIISGAVIVALLVSLVEMFGLRDFVQGGGLQASIEQAGILAPLLFMAVYAGATIVFIPGTPLTLLGGALFGPVWGTVYVVLGATLGALGAFLFAR